MKVFLSWSGDSSHRLAKTLRDWLPNVIQALEPYVSSEDITKGARWSADLAKELENSCFGILCITCDSVDAPWLNFEAGALSKEVDKSRVCPVLFGITDAEISDMPVLQFQTTKYQMDDVKKLMVSLNDALEEQALDSSRLDVSFEKWWPQLETDLNILEAELTTIAARDKDEALSMPAKGSSDAILSEILELTRAQQKILRSPEELLPPGYLSSVIRERYIGLPIDHPAWSDVMRALDDAQEYISDHLDDELMPIDTFKEMIDKIGSPLRYILRKSRRLMRPGQKELF